MKLGGGDEEEGGGEEEYEEVFRQTHLENGQRLDGEWRREKRRRRVFGSVLCKFYSIPDIIPAYQMQEQE